LLFDVRDLRILANPHSAEHARLCQRAATISLMVDSFPTGSSSGMIESHDYATSSSGCLTLSVSQFGKAIPVPKGHPRASRCPVMGSLVFDCVDKWYEVSRFGGNKPVCGESPALIGR
jgi:hypothetical protein